jgi:hypothetical protein
VDGLALIRKILRSSESQAGYKKVTCNLLLHGRTPSTEDQFQVYGEELLCYSMFSNLLKNALEASPKGGVITITLDAGLCQTSQQFLDLIGQNINSGILPNHPVYRGYEHTPFTGHARLIKPPASHPGATHSAPRTIPLA